MNCFADTSFLLSENESRTNYVLPPAPLPQVLHKSLILNGAGGRIRTDDLRITNALLYH